MANLGKIAALVQALDARFQAVANKVTSWGDTPSDNKYPSEKLVKDSLDTKENLSNKVSSFGVTPSDDKYPSEKLVKDSLDLKEVAANKVTSFGVTPSDEKYPSEKLVKTELDKKLESTDLPTYTSDLINNGDDADDDKVFLTEHQSLASTIVTVEKQTNAETGYAHTYVIKQNNTQVGSKINIPKDFLVKSGEVKTAAAADLTNLGQGYSVGDKYIDFVINTKGGDGTDEHMYINVKDLVEDTTYTADETTLTLTGEEFSIKDGGVDTTQIADSAITTAKINANAVTTAKIADKAVTASQIADSTITSTQIASSLSSTWLTDSDVDDEIEVYVDALTEALSPTQESASEGGE